MNVIIISMDPPGILPVIMLVMEDCVIAHRHDGICPILGLLVPLWGLLGPLWGPWGVPLGGQLGRVSVRDGSSASSISTGEDSIISLPPLPQHDTTTAAAALPENARVVKEACSDR